MHIPIIGKKSSSRPKPPSIDTKIPEYKRPPPVTEKSGSSTSTPSYGSKSRSNSNSSRSAMQDYGEVPSSPSSLTKRQVSDKVKQTPSSYVRNSRVYSNDFNGFTGFPRSDSHNSLNHLAASKNANSFSNMLQSTKSVPPELSPIVSLFTSHGFRSYYHGYIFLHDNGDWKEVSAKLTGNELSLWCDETEFNPKYYNLFDYNITLDVSNCIIKFSNDLNETFYNVILRTETPQDFESWVTAMFLLNFEKLSLNEAFTAVILSIIGPKLSDIHTLLSKKKFPKFEWCNIRLPQINHQWLKCYMAIYPSSGKKKGKIEIYQLEKMSKKNLICHISNVTNAYNIFPENVNMIEFNSIMKLNGDVYVNTKFEHLFTTLTSTSMSNTNSSTSFNKSHQRVASNSSFFSTSSSPPSSPKIKSSSSFIKTNYIYLMPQGHPGVQEIETMIRNYIPILDAFKLYGRPKQLNSNKFDKTSLLFGLPSLPHYEFLSLKDAHAVVSMNIKSAENTWSTNTWNNEFKNLIEFKMANENYKGSGNIGHLYKSLELDDSDILSLKSSPSINFPQGSINEFSPSPMPGMSPPASPTIDGQSGFSTPRVRSASAGTAGTTNHDSIAFRFENFDNYENQNSMDRVTSPVSQLGELDEPIKLHPYRQKA